MTEFKGLYSATNVTKFDNPKPLPVDPVRFLYEYVGVRKIAIADTLRYPSRREQGGKFVDEFDLRAIQGIALRYAKGNRPSGGQWAFYVIADDSVGVDDVVTPEGRIIPSQFTVWVPARFVKYAEESDLLFVGTVDISQPEGMPFMNAISIVPIRARPIS